MHKNYAKSNPPAFPEVETIAIGDNKSVIVITVSGKLGTYCYDGRPYIRHGPTTQVMPRAEYEKRVLDKFHAHRRWENEVAPDWVTVADLDEEVVILLRNGPLSKAEIASQLGHQHISGGG